MVYDKKVIVYSPSGEVDDMQALVEQWRGAGVNFIAFVGAGASRMQDDFLDACVMSDLREGRDGRTHDAGFILSSFHEGEGLEDAMALAFALAPGPIWPVCIVQL